MATSSVQRGMPVRDLDGRLLGRVSRLDEWGLEYEKGLLFKQGGVAPWREVHALRDGTVVLARSERALFQLAAGQIPDTWRGSEPPPVVGPLESVVPGTAHPTTVVLGPKDEFPREPVLPETLELPLTWEEERRYVASRGQSLHEPPGTGVHD
ncbi:hypothetical protein [Anaeromyxobacter paludicola]|uniref:PRC-barrel domain-containing protein n=1 Tax=Anaeromyxobacter paludicola TaxID=2918171 RepID=A0ABM7XEK3_9BACT|nr:hypothetical protein [Anaeromyxobacter paludicola]BDG10245.1 hypothetical protein AMPC_33580 [Anaeromyxobacter paludicola]